MADTHPPLLISNFWGFTTTQWESVFTEVSLYPDMIIFFLNASLHSPPPHYRALQTAHTLSLSAFSLFLPLLCVTPTDSPLTPSSPATLSSWSVSVWKPHYVLLLDLQTQLDRELQSRSELARLHCVFVRGWTHEHMCSVCVCVCADTCMCDRWWINQEGLHQCDSAQVVRFSPFPSIR